MSDNMQSRLQYNYAQINPNTYQCIGCFTCSYEIPIPTEYILVPTYRDDYYGKYYNFNDGLWYWDAAFTQLWEEAPQWD